MEYIYIGVVVLAIVAIGFVLVPFLKRKGLVEQDNIDLTEQLLALSEIITNKIIKDKEVLEKSKLVFKIAKEVVTFIEVTAKTSDNDEKKKLAYETIEETLRQLGIILDEDDKVLINFAIESAVNLLPKTYI